MMTEETKHYLYGKQIGKLLNYLLTGLLYNKPDNYLLYLKDILDEIESKRVDELSWDKILTQSRKPKLNLTSIDKEFTHVGDAVEESYFERIKNLNSKCLSSTEHEEFGSLNSKSTNPMLILIIGLQHRDHLAFVKELMFSEDNFHYFNFNVLLREKFENCDQMEKIFNGNSKSIATVNLWKCFEEQTENILQVMELLSKTFMQNKCEETKFIFIDGLPMDEKMLKLLEGKIGEIHAVLLLTAKEGIGTIDDCNQESGDGSDGHKNSDGLKRKINLYKTYMVPLVDYLDNAGKLILPVDVRAGESSRQDVRLRIFEYSLQLKKS